jgi:hypothetical protein
MLEGMEGMVVVVSVMVGLPVRLVLKAMSGLKCEGLSNSGLKARAGGVGMP